MLFSAIPVVDGSFSGPSLQHAHIDYIIKKNFTCHGDEDELLNCTYYNKISSYCNDSDSRMKPAGVYYFGQTNGQSKSLDINKFAHFMLKETRCDDNEIRLSNGTNASGRVEVCLGDV